MNNKNYVNNNRKYFIFKILIIILMQKTSFHKKAKILFDLEINLL